MANTETIIDRQDVSMRRMRDDIRDYRLVSKWLSDERVLELVFGRDNAYDLDRVRQKYGPQVRGEGPVVPCILVYRCRPIGFIQFYGVLDGKEYDIEDVEGVYGVDLFIGEPELWGQGIGTKTLSALIDYLFGDLRALRVVIDPRVFNARAIRCYEKCGFKKIRVLPEHELHEGAYRDAWLMSIESAEWMGSRRGGVERGECEVASWQSLKAQVNEVIEALSEHEQQVMRLRFGLTDGRSRTLQETGHVMGMTPERARQLEITALKKLRRRSVQ